MELTNYSVFICVFAPLLLMVFMVDKRSRMVAISLVVGLVLCMMASEINTIFLGVFNNDYLYTTTSITPIVEEVLKALPIVYLFYVWDSKLETVLAAAFAVGVGFAIMENLVIMVNNPGDINIIWAFIRGCCTGLMHAICTDTVAIALVFLGRERKLGPLALFASLALAITYHGTFNVLVQSDYMQIGFLLPILSYVILGVMVFLQRGYKKKMKQIAQDASAQEQTTDEEAAQEPAATQEVNAVEQPE